MTLRYFVKILILFTFLSSPVIGRASSSLKSDALEALEDLSLQNRNRMTEIDREIKDVLMQSHNSNLTPRLETTHLTNLNQRLEKLTLERKEHYLRQNFLDRLKFQIDRKYANEDFKSFLSQTVLQMAQTEATSYNGDIGFTKFCNYLSLAIKEIPEPSENILAFIEGYMKFSSIINPTSPTEYLSYRNYTNGFDSYSAHPVSREEVGDVVEKRLVELQNSSQLQRTTFEKRQPIMKPLEATIAPKSSQGGYEIKDPVETQIKNNQTIENLKSHMEPTEAELSEKTPTPKDPLQLRIKMDQIHKAEPELTEPSTAGEAAPASSGYVNE
ncbi:MAG: hypothetical protein KDD34_06755 [Bdellovibrionales bacterium]|nr:hypothetical protein [Bdellovibrionales bacterium]